MHLQLPFGKFSIGLLAFALITTAAYAQPDTCVITKQSELHFSVSNLKFNTVRGTLGTPEGFALIDKQVPENSTIEVSVPVDGIETGVGKRDRHLLEDDFFDVARHPTLKARSEAISHAAAEGRYLFEGELELKGIAKPLSCSFSAKAHSTGYWLEAEFAVARLDYDLGSSYGSFTIGEEVEVHVKLHCVIK